MKQEFILQGGLGNQLFILLEACRYKLLNFDSLHINISDYRLNSRDDRDFSVHRLLPGLSSQFTFCDDKFSQVRLFFSKVIGRLFVTDSLPNRLPGDGLLVSNLIPGFRTYRSYFQYINQSNIDNEALSLIRTFLCQEKISKNNRLAVHVRRGDYLLTQHAIHGLVPLDAVINEIKKVISRHQYSGVTIFTDSPELISLEDFSDFKIDIDVDVGGDPVDVMLRMASHCGIIAANSSFSLWAGILGQPNYFSIPEYWMPGVKSSMFNIKNITRYQCIL